MHAEAELATLCSEAHPVSSCVSKLRLWVLTLLDRCFTEFGDSRITAQYYYYPSNFMKTA